jgi:hypothetical protein
MVQLSVTVAGLTPISQDRPDHCLAGRPPSPQPSRNLTESARNGQSRARTPSRCPERQVIAPATAPGLARLSVAPHHGADYYLSLGTRPPRPAEVHSLLERSTPPGGHTPLLDQWGRPPQRGVSRLFADPVGHRSQCCRPTRGEPKPRNSPAAQTFPRDPRSCVLPWSRRWVSRVKIPKGRRRRP